MKRLLILYAILAFCFSTVSALQVSSPNLAGLPGANVNTTFTVTNDNGFVVSNISASSTADARYNISFENVPPSLGANQSAVITVKGKIPLDFAYGKRSIGAITVTSTAPSQPSGPFGSHTFTPQSQTPQQVVLPVAMSASNDFGQNTPDPGMPIIGQWHSGVQDGVNDIVVKYPYEGAVEAGWARIHSDNYTDYWVGAVSLDGGGQAQVPPSNWVYGGKIHTSPGLLDGQIELQSGDSGWLGLYSKPEADGKLLFVVAESKCGGSPQTVPSTGVVLGKVATPGVCDGNPEGFAYDGTALDAGFMSVVFVPYDRTPVNFLPVGEFESLNGTGFYGWAYDNDTPATTVNVFVDGTFWKDLTASVARPDLVTAGKVPDANHGFSYTFTQSDLSSLGNGANHTFQVIAINSPEGDNPALNGSPKALAGFTSNTPGTGSTSGTGVLYMENTLQPAQNNQTNQSTNQNTSNTNQNANNSSQSGGLVIDRVKITCDKLTTVYDGASVDAVPGQTCYLTVKVKNTFANKDIDDITIEVDPENSDVSGDTADISSLNDGDSEEKTLELVVDDEAEGEIDVDINVEGEDENGVKRSDSFQFTLDIERAKHDLQVTRITISPKEAKLCENSRIDVSVYVENKGQRDEDNAAVELSVSSLGFVKKISDLSISTGEEQRVYFTIPVSSSTKTGSFRATAKAFYDGVGLSGTKTADFSIVRCEQKQEVVNNNEPLVTPPPYVPQDELIVVPPAQEEQNTNSSWTGSAVLTGVLVLANLVALTVLGVMAYGYFKKKPEEEFEAQFEEPVEPSNIKDYY